MSSVTGGRSLRRKIIEMEFNFLTTSLIAISVILAALIYWINRRQDYFKNFDVPYVRSLPLLGAFSDAVLGKSGFYDNVRDICERPEVKGKPFFGIFLFHKPALMVTEPELIKRILVKVKIC